MSECVSRLSDNYPAMDADSCDSNGIMGNCGPDCTALAVGKCPEAEGWFRAAVYVAVNYPAKAGNPIEEVSMKC